MVCPNCHAENADGSTFCKMCGKRMDGRIPCPACRHLNDDDAVYCNACGTRLDGEAPAGLRKATSAERSGMRFDWKKLLTLLGGICAMSAVFFSLLFVFFTGLKAEFSASFVSIADSFGLGNFTKKMTATTDLYYFFGEGYREVKAALDALPEYSEFYSTNSYVFVIFGTVVSAGLLIAVPVLAVLATVRFVNHLLGKTEKRAGTLACATYFAFLGGSLLLLALYNEHAEIGGSMLNYVMDYMDINSASPLCVKVGFNGATVAGLVLGGIFTGLYLATCIVLRGRQLLSKRIMTSTILTVVGTVFSILVIVFASGTISGFALTIGKVTLSYGTGETLSLRASGGLNPLSMLSALSSEFIAPEYAGKADKAQLLLLLAAGFSLIVIVLAVFNLVWRTREFERPRASLAFPIALAGAVIAHLVVGILAAKAFYPLVTRGDEDLVLTYASLILTLVFSVLSLLLSVAHFVALKLLPEQNE